MLLRSVFMVILTGGLAAVIAAQAQVDNSRQEDTPSGKFTIEEVSWKNGEISLVGTLYVPVGRGPFPAAIMLHGSGTLARSDRAYREHGERLARAGLAFLVFDKRGVGGSSGDWKTASLNDLADDAEAGVEILRGHKDVDAKRIGLLGFSQGAWVASIMAARSDELAFLVWLSGTPITPAEQGHYIVEAALRRKNFDEAAIKKALELDRAIVDVYRTDRGWEEISKRVDAAASEPWFKDASIGLQPRGSWNWKWYSRFFDYDPMPDLQKVRAPMFAVYGELDPIIPVEKSLQFLGALRDKSRRDITTLTIPAVGHDLSIRKGPQPEHYWRELVGWLTKRKILSY